MSAVETRLKAAADRLRETRAAASPKARFVVLDIQVVDALTAWLDSDATAAAFISEIDNDDTVTIAFGESLATADAILWDVPR